MKKKTLEREVADTILQRKRRITIGGRVYSVAPPTAATLIQVSAEVSELPGGMRIDGDGDYFSATILGAKDCAALGRILATMMIGARPTLAGQLVARLRITGQILFSKKYPKRPIIGPRPSAKYLPIALSSTPIIG